MTPAADRRTKVPVVAIRAREKREGTLYMSCACERLSWQYTPTQAARKREESRRKKRRSKQAARMRERERQPDTSAGTRAGIGSPGISHAHRQCATLTAHVCQVDARFSEKKGDFQRQSVLRHKNQLDDSGGREEGGSLLLPLLQTATAGGQRRRELQAWEAGVGERRRSKER